MQEQFCDELAFGRDERREATAIAMELTDLTPLLYEPIEDALYDVVAAYTHEGNGFFGA